MVKCLPFRHSTWLFVCFGYRVRLSFYCQLHIRVYNESIEFALHSAPNHQIHSVRNMNVDQIDKNSYPQFIIKWKPIYGEYLKDFSIRNYKLQTHGLSIPTKHNASTVQIFQYWIWTISFRIIICVEVFDPMSSMNDGCVLTHSSRVIFGSL